MVSDYILFDGIERRSLFPLTYLRPICHCRVGIQTIKEKWEHYLGNNNSYLTPPYLSAQFPYSKDVTVVKTFINGAFLPNDSLIQALKTLPRHTALICQDSIIAFKANNIGSLKDIDDILDSFNKVEMVASRIHYPEDILRLSRQEFLSDYKRLAKVSTSHKVNDSVKVRGDRVFIGAEIKANDAIINATDGPVFIDDGAEIMEGVVIRGPVYIGKRSKVHVGAKIYADTIIGPDCRIGGEVKRTTFFGYSNKGHDGYVGDSIIGHWCNLGANTNNSNMKNTYGMVSLWDIETKDYRTTDRQFLGMIMGDHTMCAINTSFNTGSVTGIFSNILDRNPNRFTPSFSWGKAQKYNVDKAIFVAKIAMSRRSVNTSHEYESAIRHIAALI